MKYYSFPLRRVLVLLKFDKKILSFQILWSLSSVDFHTLTLQLPIQAPNSVAPELHIFVSSLEISAKRAHPRGPFRVPKIRIYLMRKN